MLLHLGSLQPPIPSAGLCGAAPGKQSPRLPRRWGEADACAAGLGAVTGGRVSCTGGSSAALLITRHVPACGPSCPKAFHAPERGVGVLGTAGREAPRAALFQLPPEKPLSLPRLLEELEGLHRSIWRPAAPSPSKPQQLPRGQMLPCHTRKVLGCQQHRVTPGAAWPSPAPCSPSC